MKKLLVAISLITMFSLARAAQADSKLYRASCNSTWPLPTYDPCTPYSEAGRMAYRCAYDEVYDACRTDDSRKNQDCVDVGVPIIEPKISTEFIGYKYCKATVFVRGWQ